MGDELFGELSDFYEGKKRPLRLWQGSLDNRVFEKLKFEFETSTEDLTLYGLNLEHFLTNQEEYKSKALAALSTYYQTEVLPVWEKIRIKKTDFLDLAPYITSAEELEPLLSFPKLLVYPFRKENITLGLTFECSWDVEHGTGLMFRNVEVIQVGSAELAAYPGFDI